MMLYLPIRLSLGTELLIQKGGGMEAGLLSLGGGYKTDNWETTAKIGMHAWNLTYIHKSSKVGRHFIGYNHYELYVLV